jgi:hypothetical protein
MAEQVLSHNFKKLNTKDLVTICYLFIENNKGSPKFRAEIEEQLYPALYTVPADDLGELLWSMQLIMREQWYGRFAEMVIKRLEELQTKHLTQIVWMLSDHYKRTQDEKLNEVVPIPLGLDVQEGLLPTDAHLLQLRDRHREGMCSGTFGIRSELPHSGQYRGFHLRVSHRLRGTHCRMGSFYNPLGVPIHRKVHAFTNCSYTPENVTRLFDKLYPVTLASLEDLTIHEMLVALRAYILSQRSYGPELIAKAIEYTKCM